MLIMVLSIYFFSLGLYQLKFNITLVWEWELFYLNSCEVIFLLYMDYLCFLFMSFVLLISSMVVWYSSEYMEEDNNKNRFLLLVILFVISMMFLILSPNLISMLLGWDGLGLVSYCLVIFFQNVKSASAGMLTALTNRIGDVLILASIALMMSEGSWNYMMKVNSNIFALTILFFVLASMTKSAQIPFSSWLPAAMAAPTPVSSLVHSSTLVTAGVYSMIRFNNFLMSEEWISNILLFSGSMTMLMSGISANFETDIKKIIALSTLSQLGVMMSTLSIGFKELAFFHLIMHALFKALLFMCAGGFIHSSNNNQDIRFFGLLLSFSPLTTAFFNVSNLALCGFPFLSGFYSKDLILEKILMNSMNLMSMIMFILATMLTVMYTIRLLEISLNYSVMYFKPHFSENSFSSMKRSMILLFFFSIVMGCFGSNLFFFPYNTIILPFYLKFLIILICMLGALLSYLYSKINFSMYSLFNKVKMFDFFGSMWFLTFFSSSVMKNYSLLKSSKLTKILMFGWIEEMTGNKLNLLYRDFNNIINKEWKSVYYKTALSSFTFILILFCLLVPMPELT
uniref:NADH-ubiquinone oxidoreductase chain 5 n=1 Tax=Holarthrothrips indicus TaxID=1965675 RepID=A0A8A5L8T3_9NEOP|nr:NADH dehydrogenase subunit 5 [Holarthrothrips indicus]